MSAINTARNTKRLLCIPFSFEHPRLRYCFAALLFTPSRNVTIGQGRKANMSVLNEKREELEHYEFRMGVARGRLAVALDSLTDALTMVGQHGVYCQSARQPGKPAMDIQIVMKGITDAKELITSVMEEIRKQTQENGS